MSWRSRPADCCSPELRCRLGKRSRGPPAIPPAATVSRGHPSRKARRVERVEQGLRPCILPRPETGFRRCGAYQQPRSTAGAGSPSGPATQCRPVRPAPPAMGLMCAGGRFSSGIVQPRCNPVDRGPQRVIQVLAVVAVEFAAEEFDLDQAHRVHVGIAQADGP
jgi:hypothetical protein